MKNEITAKRFIERLKTFQSSKEREKILRYFKTPANGEADQFIGVRMGQVFALAKEFITMTPDQIEKLLESKIHEVRAGACSIMDKQARSKKTSPERRKELYDLYLRRHDRINNWDLVDVCSIHVVGGYLFDKPRKILYKLACSKNMWERRTAIVSTAYFIRKDELDDAYKIAEMLLGDKEDLVHKATGWMLRFAGDKDRPRLLEFLDQHAATMPRVALRYAMEHLDKKQRDHYLGLKKRTMTKPVFNLAAILVMLVACAAVSVLAAPQAKVAARKEVKVYFYHDPGEYIDLMPVTRSVNANAPARPAIEALLKGPTKAELRKGFGSLASATDFRIGSLKISGGTARINFISNRRWAGWSGDLAPVRFKTAVELTLKQFPSVRRVIVSLNGDEKFYDESGG